RVDTHPRSGYRYRVTLLLLLACTGEPVNTDPTITIVAPADGSTVCGTPLVVETVVENFTLVEPFPEGTEELPEPGTGHIDVALNGQEASDWMFGGETLVIPSVPDGDGAYQIKVELSNADHTPIEPYAGDYVYVTVDTAACE
ncbi:MAG: hypothetical protein ACK4YP_18600, partial [Myxococcota bacterium]